MKIIKPTVELMKHDTDLYSFIEKVGRVCYKSEDKIKDGSAVKFVTQLVKNGHLAVCEHEYLYLKFTNYNDIIHFISSCWVPDSHSYNIHRFLNISEYCISGSVRAWIEFFEEVHKISQKYEIGKGIYIHAHKCFCDTYPDLFPLFGDWNYTEKDEDGIPLGMIYLQSREDFMKDEHKPSYSYFNLLPHTLKFTADRGFLAEITRHRLASFAAESTRFCNYSNGKFGEEITVIGPCFFPVDSPQYDAWKLQCEKAELCYMALTNNCSKPEEARTILPQSLKCEVVVTATESEWQHIINLRYHGTTGRPHPQMEEVMEMAYPILVIESEGRIK